MKTIYNYFRVFNISHMLAMMSIFFLIILLTGGSQSEMWLYWHLWESSSHSGEMVLLWDCFSLLFIVVVMWIASSIFMYSYMYMSNEKKFNQFHLLLMIFVLSMILLVLTPHLLLMLLGWDGLGITSFLLVVFYNNNKSRNAGMLTAVTNRVGDALIIVLIASMVYKANWEFSSYTSQGLPHMDTLLLVTAAFTKSAQLPFSAWLPAAMAAPTPVSSLVHSSTLVTAGVFILIRHGDFIPVEFKKMILVVGVLTMTMASLSALSEVDMKKMVALSTLSQLGVMVVAIGLGQLLLATSHLLIHAFFKAMLFISTGNVIHSNQSYQSLSKVDNPHKTILVSSTAMVVCSLSLCGLPFMSAFYSKEKIIESMIMLPVSMYLFFIMVVGIMLTAAYSLRFVFMLTAKPDAGLVLKNTNEDSSLNLLSIIMLLLPAIVGGLLISCILLNVNCPFLSPAVKLMGYISFPLSIMVYLIIVQVKINNVMASWNILRMWAITFYSSKFPTIISVTFTKMLGQSHTKWNAMLIEGVTPRGFPILPLVMTSLSHQVFKMLLYSFLCLGMILTWYTWKL